MEGFIRSIFALMGLDLDVPDYSLLSKRQGEVDVDLVPAGTGTVGSDEERHLVLDATGLKVYGEGEWKQRTHGKQKRRTWRKLHLGVDADTGEITATTLTDNTEHDASQTEVLLEETNGDLRAVGADGAYDTWDAYDAITDQEARPVIPPQKNAKIKKHGNCKGPPLARDEAIRYIRQHGRKKSLIAGSIQTAQAQDKTSEPSNNIYVEIGGAGVLGSLNYERLILSNRVGCE